MPEHRRDHSQPVSMLSLSARRRFGFGLAVLALLWLCIFWAVMLP